MRAAVAALMVLLASAPAAAARWTVVPEKSRLSFTAVQAEAPFTGEFKRFVAKIAFDPDALDQSKAVVTVDLASAVTGASDRDEALPAAVWFNVAEHPKATFETTGFRSLGEGRYAADATLTIKGTTRDVTLPFTLTISGGTAHAEGSLTIDRLDFNVGTGDFSTGKWIDREVTVTVDLVATKAHP